MKRKIDEWDLRNAFAQEPESCHEALMHAARSVKEDEPMKKASFRIVLIAAAILAATVAVAVAAGNLLGWSDFFTQYGTVVPETAQRVMGEAWNKHTFTLGPVTFSTQELFCDGHIAMASTEISMADGGDALICAEPFDPIGAIGENGEQMAARLGVASDLTWIEAAKALHRRLYNVRAILEVPAEIDSGCAMEDILWNEDGHAVYFSMPELNGKAQGEAVDMQLFLRVAEIDLETEAEKEPLTRREPLNVYLEAPLETHAYAVNSEFAPDNFRLERVQVELSSAGLYIYSAFTAPQGATADDAYAHFPEWLDADGHPFPMGISLSSSVDADNLPAVVYTQMISVDAIPDRMILQVPLAAPVTAEENAYSQLVLSK